ncbi:MAG TPA: TonB-dependent receptor [Lentimicrobium sp.]|nr:TonB-dependent receptor [Lentimicrobium sp.]
MNKNLRNLIMLLVLILNVNLLFAQGHKVTGRINDAKTGTGLPGVTVVEKNTQNGTTTDVNGRFNLNVSSSDAILVISFIGYQKQEIPLAGKAVITANLDEEITDLSEVVVIGYGSQKKKVVTGAIAHIDSEEITAAPITRIEQSLQGFTAGVQVTNQSGQPGDQPTIRIRGIGTTGNSDPIYVVDGFVVGGIDYLNPGDIESIDVLKDAASAAIYGSSAANGVILITTKQGKAGKMNISYTGYYGFQNPYKKLDMLNADQYRMMMNEAAVNGGLPEPYDLNEVTPNTNWQDVLFEKNAPMQSHELSVSGGNEKSTYLSSLAYSSTQGIIGGDKSQFDRLSARLNTSHKVNRIIRVGNDLSFSHILKRGIGTNQSFNGAFSSALNLDPLTPLYMTDPEKLSQAPYSTQPVVRDEFGNVYAISENVGAEVVNPIALLETQHGKTRVDKLVGNIYGEIEPIEGLKLRTAFNVDAAYVLDDGYSPLFYLNGAQYNLNKTSVYKNIRRWFGWQWDNTVSYTKSINDHKFTVLGGTSAFKMDYEDLSGSNSDVIIIDPEHVYLGMATDSNWRANGYANQESKASLFGRLTYDYKERYALTAIVRRDGSSKFGANNKYGVFPSIGVSWVVSDESFFPQIKLLNTLKFRASYGVNGNDHINNYMFVSTVDKSRRYIIGGASYIGASPRYVENQDIQWEESEQTDLALDMEALGHRLIATIDFYKKTTNGLLETIPIPAHVGNDPPVANVGSVENKGVEISLGWREVIRGFKYSIGLNGAYNKNEMTYIGNPEKVISGANWAIAGMVTRTEEGFPIAYFYGYKTDGIFQDMNEIYHHINAEGDYLQPLAKPGDVRFVDVNGDGVISPLDRTMIGSPHPDWTVGLNASFEYMNFDLSFLIYGAFGQEIFNGSQRQDLDNTNRTTKILERWTGPGTSNEIPRFVSNRFDQNQNYRVSDLYIEDGSFVRLRNIQLGYTLPENLLKRINSENFRVFVSVENLLTLTKYTGADPEIGAFSSFDIGIDRGIYPQARTVRIGTTITF